MTEPQPDSSVNKQGKAFDKDTVVKIVQSVVSRLHEDDAGLRAALLNELMDLHNIIQKLRGDISSIQPKSIQEEEIPSATDELDAVVEATEEATGTIMDSAEHIEQIAQEGDPDKAQKISDQVIRIYEACSFQDITGQRITKVISALHNIENKVGQLLSVVNGLFPGALHESGLPGADDRTGDAALLNGPALPDTKVSQDDIDAILAEFDN